MWGSALGSLPVSFQNSNLTIVNYKSRLITSAEKSYTRDLKEYFAKRGVTYEEDNSFHPQLARKLVDLVPLKVGDSVLDVATGTGYVAFNAAAKVGKSGAVIGIDNSRTMLTQVCILRSWWCVKLLYICVIQITQVGTGLYDRLKPS